MAYYEYILMGVILLPGIIFAIYAQSKVNSCYRQYSEIPSRKNITAKEAVREILSGANLNNVNIETISGSLTDHYDPTTNTVRLSEEIASSTSIAALGVAMHEVGHAIQYNKGYFPIKLRNASIKFSNVVSYLLWPLVCLGIIFNFIYLNGVLGEVFLWSGIAFFGLSFLVNLITLPVEYNASNRAIAILDKTEMLTQDELPGCKKVLRAAALTYVAALIISLLNILRFVLVFGRKNE